MQHAVPQAEDRGISSDAERQCRITAPPAHDSLPVRRDQRQLAAEAKTIEPATQLPPDAQAALRQGTLDAVMFFSPRTAHIFGELVFSALADASPTQRLTAFCISPATAQALGPHRFAQVAIATRPNQDAMLALIK